MPDILSKNLKNKWSPSKEFITQLQLAPEIPPVIPVAPYPEAEGTYKGSRYYITATTPLVVDDFLKNYLSFMAQAKEITYLGRERTEISLLALYITQNKKSDYDKAKAILDWVYKNIKYERTNDFVMPWELIKPGINGDCKSFTTLIASLLGVVKIPCWFKLVKIDGYETLHVYNLASLSWEAVDGVGGYFSREVKPVSGYILFEMDKTINWPPKPLPSEAGIYLPEIPEKLKQILPLIGVFVGSAGVISLALLKK